MFNWKAENEEKKQFVTVGEGESQHVIPLDYITNKKEDKENVIKVQKETKKAYLLNKDGVDFWVPKRWFKDGKLTPAGEKSFEAKKKFKKTSESLKNKNIKLKGKPDWESEKAIGIDVNIDYYDLEKDKKVRVFIPKSQIKNNYIPFWLYKKKIQEIIDNSNTGYGGFTIDHDGFDYSDFSEDEKNALYQIFGQKLQSYIADNSEDEIYTILDNELYLLKDLELKAENQILLDEQVGGKGRRFETRFLQAGLVKYSFGVCLLEKETIDKFIYNFVGCPVIINHKDVTNQSAKDDRVGVISRVWFNERDGWYWGEGVIFEQEALDLIDKGFNVSCQYEITEYSSTGGLHNGNNYDKTILNGKPEHLAIVQNPRYENAMIAINAMEIEAMEAINEEKKQFVTVGEGESAHAIPVDYLKKDKKETATKQADKKEEPKYTNLSDLVKAEREIDSKFGMNNENIAKYHGSEENYIKNKISQAYQSNRLSKDLKDKILNKAIELLKDVKPGKLGYSKTQMNKVLNQAGYNIYKSEKPEEKEVFTKQPKKEEKSKKQEVTQLKLFSKNDIIQAINDIKGLDMFKNLFKKRSKNMDREEIKDIMMECLTELTASNEAEKKDEPDYKKMYEDLKAENEKAKKEAEEKEEKEVEEKEAENKCDKAKNSIEEQKEAMMSPKVEVKSTYITQIKARELGRELF